MPKEHVTVQLITVKQIGFEGLSLKMLMEMAGSRSCRGSAFHEDGPDEQNVRGL